jgi:pimeloyl-ACP methyl ester carboxylesterase
MERPMITPRATLATAMGAVVALTVVLSGCGKPEAEPPAAPADSEIQLPADLSGTGPGTVKSAAKLPTVDRRILKVSSTAARIVYESQSGVDESPQLVSGSVFAPMGEPPANGWPIIAFGHGTNGVTSDCAPSLSPNLLGISEVVATLVRLGYVVVLPDYQGLGMDNSYHPYLDASTEGYNMIDAVRAARKVIPQTSDNWMAVGLSQGGQAAWAANELNGGYGAGLNIVGSVSVAPAADITGLADAAVQGPMTLEQASAYIWLLYALKKQYPDLNLDDYRRGIVKEKWDLFTACIDHDWQERLDLGKKITRDDLRPATPEAADRLRGYLQRRALPKFPASAPMMILYGDQDQLVTPAWTAGAIRRACAMGDTITSYVAAGRGHTDIDPGVSVFWIKQRFDGAPADNTCNRPDNPSVQVGQTPWYSQ